VTTTLIARAGLGVGEFAELAGVDRSIFYRVGRPLRASTAWKIANAYAGKVGVTPEEAYARLITSTGDGREAKRQKVSDAAD
jgi:hypothetical protein